MTRSCVAVAAALLLSGMDGSELAGQAGAAPQTSHSYVSATTAILVDVVVRDGKGRPVIDLSAADFEVEEDGVAQKVDTFARVSRGGGIGVGVAWKSPGRTVAVRPSPDPAARRDRERERGHGRGDDGARVRSPVLRVAAIGAEGDARLRPDERSNRRLRDRSRHSGHAGVYDRPGRWCGRRSNGSCRPAPLPRSRRRTARTI